MKCNLCGNTVDIENVHSQSLKVPQNGEFSAVHVRCFNQEDMSGDEFNEWLDTIPEGSDEPQQAWITHF